MQLTVHTFLYPQGATQPSKALINLGELTELPFISTPHPCLQSGVTVWSCQDWKPPWIMVRWMEKPPPSNYTVLSKTGRRDLQDVLSGSPWLHLAR